MITIYRQAYSKITPLFILFLVALSFYPASANAETIEIREGNVILTRVQIYSGPIPYTGNWGPLIKSSLIELTVPKALDGRTFRFVKRNRSSEECNKSSAYVELRSGQATTPQQMMAIFGSEKVERFTGIVLCIAGGSQVPDKVILSSKYEKVISEQEPEDGPTPTPPPVKTNVLRSVNPFLSIRTITCQQDSASYGCSFRPASGYCPAGFELTRARATCNLEKSELLSLPSRWNIVQVGRASDRPSDGRCSFGSVIRQGSRSVTASDLRQFRSGLGIACSEKDSSDGGNCSINAEFACEKAVTRTLTFGCSREGSNRGCTGTVRCPTGFRPARARASCNLETTTTPDLPRWDQLRVAIRTDKNKDAALCQVGRSSTNGSRRQIKLVLPAGGPIRYACKENDKNGGDCRIVGELQCTNRLLNIRDRSSGRTRN